MILPFHNYPIEIPFRSCRSASLLLPAGSCQELEWIPANTQSSRGGRALFSPHPTLLLLLAKVGVLAGTPRLCTVCSGRRGIPLTSNYQFLYMWEDIFWHMILISSCLTDSAPPNLFFWHAYVVLSCQKVCTKYWNEGWIYTLQLPGGMGC